MLILTCVEPRMYSETNENESGENDEMSCCNILESDCARCALVERSTVRNGEQSRVGQRKRWKCRCGDESCERVGTRDDIGIDGGK